MVDDVLAVFFRWLVVSVWMSQGPVQAAGQNKPAGA